MPAAELEPLVRQIHASGRRFVLAVTGGGSAAVSQLLAVPGASQSILEALVPYGEPALVEFLGGRPDHFCSPATARAMAMASFNRGLGYSVPPAELVGLGCTASLASDRPKRGPHRLHAALQTLAATTTVSLELNKGLRTRAEEEALAAAVVLNLVAEAAGLSGQLPTQLGPGEQFDRATQLAPAPWQHLLLGQSALVAASAIGGAQLPRAVFPGAFNPLHAGHRQIAAVAEQMLGERANFEISMANVDKPPLDYLEIDRRLGQFGPDDAVWLTRAPRFVEKSALFPGATFLVGSDTIARLADPKYAEQGNLAAELARLTAQETKFLVFGRQQGGHFRGLSDLVLPAELAALCREVPEAAFRADISSTDLRGQAG